MHIIAKDPNPSGAHPPIQTWDEAEPPEGYAAVPDGLDLAVFYAHNGFVTLTVQDGVVTAMTPHVEAWEAWKASLSEAVSTNPATLRERAYDTEPLVEWPENSGALLTVTEAARQWQYYAAEGDFETADKLTDAIAAAKQTIRERFPDEV